MTYKEMEIEENEQKPGKSKFVYFAAASVNLLSMATGLAYAWTSPFIPKLNGSVDPDKNPLDTPTTLMQDSWIASLLSLGAMWGPIIAGIFCNRIGKKKTLLLAAAFPITSNVILIFAHNVIHLYVARFLVGVGCGCVFSIISIYVGEISEISQRGSTSIFMALSMVSIQFVTFVIGPYISMQTMSYIALTISVLFIITFGLFVPESPYYLVLDRNLSSAKTALRKLRGRKNIFEELVQIQKEVEASHVKLSFGDIVKSKPVRKSLGITLGLMFFQQSSGILAVVSYLQTIFDSTAGAISGDKSVMLVGGIQAVTVLAVTKIINHVGRKTLMIISLIGLFISLTSLGGYFYFQAKSYNLDNFSWLPVISTCCYIICFNFGIGSVPWTIISEIFPSNVKSYLSSIVSFSMLFEAFIITLTFPTLSLYLGMAGSFWLFACFVLAAIFFVVFLVPETKGKTLLQIQEMLT